MKARRDLAYRGVGPLFVVVHSASEASDDEWEQYMLTLSQHRRRVGDSFQMLIYALGGTPTASQRARLKVVLGSQPVPMAVLSGAPMVRGVVTALSWFNPLIRSFGPTQFPDALRYLLPVQHDLPTVLRTVTTLCRELDLSLTLPRELTR